VSHKFRYSKRHKFEIREKKQAFVAEFKRLLNRQNLAKVFGLYKYLRDDFKGTCKITIGLANINLKPNNVR
jgi:hypothetical protein